MCLEVLVFCILLCFVIFYLGVLGSRGILRLQRKLRVGLLVYSRLLGVCVTKSHCHLCGRILYLGLRMINGNMSKGRGSVSGRVLIIVSYCMS